MSITTQSSCRKNLLGVNGFLKKIDLKILELINVQFGCIMDFIYVVVDNGEAYPAAYASYDLAVTAIKTMYREVLEAEAEEYAKTGCKQASDVDVAEGAKGVTSLYVDKGCHIIIYKLPVKKQKM